MANSTSINRRSEAALHTLRNEQPLVLPSLLQCDFGDLRGELARLETAGVRGLHLDVMDGHFVPNLTYGMPVVEGLRRLTDLPLDVHLMIAEPSRYVRAFAEAGADNITVHVEVEEEIGPVLDEIRSLGVGTGLALNPDTPLQLVEPLLAACDLLLIMSVDAGFGGQSFNPVALSKLRAVRERFPQLLLEVDGGINASTISDCHAAGAQLFVVGSAIFGHSDYRFALEQLTAALSR